jgi:peptidoglycan hydrolase-like protein with peptidoglycan-binding domain
MSAGPIGTKPATALENRGIQLALMLDVVKEVQEALTRQGFDDVPVDGVRSSRTFEALRAFQQHNDLDPSGRLDSKTMGNSA